MKKNWFVLAALLFALLLGVLTSQRIMAQETATEEETAAQEETAADEGIDLRELEDEATGFFRDGDMEGGFKVLEDAIKKEPKNYELLTVASRVYTGVGIAMASQDRKAANDPLRRAAALMREVQAGKEELTDEEAAMLATYVYNEACCAAIDENADDAFKLMREAIELGFTDVAQIRGDSDFESIREDERFQKILEELEALDEEERESRRPSDDA